MFKSKYTKLKKRLHKYNPDDIDKFSLTGLENYCKCIRVIDGDTIDVIMEIPGFGARKLRIRLLGINTPEMKSKDLLELEYAKKSKQRLTELLCLQYNICYIKLHGDAMYNRYLGEVFMDKQSSINNESINNILLEEHLAFPYTNPHKKAIKFSKLHYWYMPFEKSLEKLEDNIKN